MTGRRGRRVVLATGAIGAAAQSAAMMPGLPDAVHAHRPSAAALPSTVWAVGWALVAVGLLVAMQWPRWSLPSMAALAGGLASWGAAWLWSWIWLGIGAAWTIGALYLMGAVWAVVLGAELERRHG